MEHRGPNSGCLRKVYRALVQGLVAADEVRGWEAWVCALAVSRGQACGVACPPPPSFLTSSPLKQGEVDVPIGRVPYPGVRGGLFAALPEGGAGAKPSRSRYRVLARDAAAATSLVDVEIFTGERGRHAGVVTQVCQGGTQLWRGGAFQQTRGGRAGGRESAATAGRRRCLQARNQGGKQLAAA